MHEFDLGASMDTLEKEIIQLPDGFDFTKTNLYAVLLLGKPEQRKPEKYANTFFLASGNSKASKWMRFACWAEKINGKRRVKGADMSALASELDELVRQASDELPNGNNKYNLLGASFYNAGIIRRGLRMYKESAEAQRQASAWYGLAGNIEMQYVCLFVAQVEETTAAFVCGSSTLIERSIRALIAMRDHIKVVIDPYPSWMQDNAHIHIAWATTAAYEFDVKVYYDDFEDDCQKWEESRFAQWAKVASVRKLLLEGNCNEVVKQNPIDLHSSSADNASLTIQVLVAQAYLYLGNKNEFGKIITAVANHNGLDGGIPMAVAKKIIEYYS